MLQVIPEELLNNPALIEDLAALAKDAAAHHGVLFRTKEAPHSSETACLASISLFPTPVAEALYNKAVSLQTHYNTLVDRISQDPDFLQEALSSTIAVDDFTARLFRIHQQVLEEGRSQAIVLALNRSDYMTEDGTSLKQIELNTISAGCGGLASLTPHIHRKILHKVGLVEEIQRIPDNNVPAGLAAGIAKAWELYGSERAVVMFLVAQKERNVFDQRTVEYELWKRNISTTRKRFEDVCRAGSLDQDKRLFVDGLEVAVVYFRHGYDPEHYPSQQYWDARLMMERSVAVKCPDISTHLTGTKKVQQVLAKPGILERFFPDEPEVVEQIRATFAGLYTLDEGPEGDRAEAMALGEPHRFVMKPHREGGGGENLFGSDLVKVLEEMQEKQNSRATYILMERIRPITSRNFLLKPESRLQISECVSELGVFGAYVRRGTETLMNRSVGHLLRTKDSGCTKGGLMVGAAVIDSLLLV